MLNFLQNNWGYIMAVIFYIINLLSAIIIYIKTKNKQKTVEAVKEATNGFIKDAEELKNLTGPERKAWVITRAKEIAGKSMTVAEIGTYIDEQVALTNQVNTNKGVQDAAGK